MEGDRNLYRNRHLQAVLFDRKLWTTQMAREWLRDHQIVPIKRVHVTEENLRYRIHEPEIYQRLRVLHLGKKKTGISFVLGYNDPVVSRYDQDMVYT